jgi:hypothetical protein
LVALGADTSNHEVVLEFAKRLRNDMVSGEWNPSRTAINASAAFEVGVWSHAAILRDSDSRHSKRALAGVILGVGMSVGAVNFMAWLFP